MAASSIDAWTMVLGGWCACTTGTAASFTISWIMVDSSCWLLGIHQGQGPSQRGQLSKYGNVYGIAIEQAEVAPRGGAYI